MLINAHSQPTDAKVHPIHSLFGFVPNWFLLGKFDQKPHYASWTLSSDDIEDVEGNVSPAKQQLRSNPNRKPIRIQIVKTKFCTYVIER